MLPRRTLPRPRLWPVRSAIGSRHSSATSGGSPDAHHSRMISRVTKRGIVWALARSRRQARALHRVASDWELLGDADPLWAVLVSPDRKGNRWSLDEFRATGLSDWQDQVTRLAEWNLAIGGHRALDFGCGVGRMCLALTSSFQHVVGVDISQAMLDQAAVVLGDARHRVTLVHNKSSDLHVLDDWAPFDLVHSLLAFQHVPRMLLPGYLTECIRLLRPGGVMIFQMPERPMGTSLKGYAFRFAPRRLVAAIQRVLLGYPAPMEMNCSSQRAVSRILADAGARVVRSYDDNRYGGHWHCRRYIAVKDGSVGATASTEEVKRQAGSALLDH